MLVKKILLGRKKFLWGKKKFGFEKVWCSKTFWFRKFFGSDNVFWVKKIVGLKEFVGLKKNYVFRCSHWGGDDAENSTTEWGTPHKIKVGCWLAGWFNEYSANPGSILQA